MVFCAFRVISNIFCIVRSQFFLPLEVGLGRLRDEDSLPDDPAAVLSDEFEGAENVESIVDSPLDVLKVHDFLLLLVNIQNLLSNVAPRGILTLADQF